MGITTLGNTTTKIAHKEESYSINNKYIATVAIATYSMVKFTVATQEVTPVTAVGDVPFGMVSAGTETAGEYVTVQTQFSAVLNGKASGAITAGDKLSAVSVDADGQTTFKKSVTTNIVCAKALEDIADTAVGVVGILRVFTEPIA